MSKATIFVAAALAFVLVGGSLDQTIAQNVANLVKEGDSTPLGGTFSTLEAFSSNRSGSIVFQNSIQGGNAFSAIFEASPNGIKVIAASGDAVAGIGTLVSLDSEVSVNDGTAVAFLSLITENGISQGTGLFIITNLEVVEVARSGQASPAGAQYSSFFDVRPNSLNNSGSLAFENLVDTGIDAIFLYDGGTVTKVAANGDATPLGGTFAAINLIQLNDEGKVLFCSDVVGGSSSSGIFVSQNGVLSNVVATGDPVPGGGEFLVGGSIGTEATGAINSLGDVVFSSGITDGTVQSFGLFLAASDGTISRLANQNDPAPGGGTFQLFAAPSINELKQVSFIATVSEVTGPAGLFFLSDTVFERIAVDGAPSPLGGTFDDIFDLSSLPKINAGGLVAFSADIIGGSANTAFFLWGGPLIRVSPGSVEFDLVAIGETDTKSVEILSTGSDPLVIQNIAAAPTPPYDLVDLPNLPLTLQPGENTTFGVTFTPEASTASSNATLAPLDDGQLTITSNAINAPTTIDLIEPVIVSDLEIDYDPEIKAGQFSTVQVKALDQDGNVNTEYFGNVRFKLLMDENGNLDREISEKESTEGIGRLNTTISLVDEGVSENIFLFTPEEQFTPDKPITSTTVLSGTAFIAIELEDPVQRDTIRVDVRSPLDLFIEEIEIQQGVKNTDIEVFQEYDEGVGANFPALPFIAEHKTAVVVHLDYENTVPIAFSHLELERITASLAVSVDNREVLRIDRMKTGDPVLPDYVFKDNNQDGEVDRNDYRHAEVIALRDAPVSLIDPNTLANPGVYTFKAELDLDSRIVEMATEQANNEMVVLKEFAATRSVRVLTAVGVIEGTVIETLSEDIFDFTRDAYPAQFSSLVFSDPNRLPRSFNPGFILDDGASLADFEDILDWWNKENPNNQYDFIIMFGPKDLVEEVCGEGTGGCAAAAPILTLAVPATKPFLMIKAGIVNRNSRSTLAHELGHLLGLNDTYKTSKWITFDGRPNPRRSDATDSGNFVEDRNIVLRPIQGANDFSKPLQRVIDPGDPAALDHKFVDFMGGTGFPDWIDRVTWDYLYRSQFSLESQSASKVASANGFIAVSGFIDKENNVTFKPFLRLERVPVVDEFPGGEYALGFEDATGALLSSFEFDVPFYVGEVGEVSQVPFSFYLPMPEGTSRVMMKRNSVELTSRTFSANPPTVQLTSPSDGEAITGLTSVAWTSSDPDGDDLTYSLLYSPDGEEQIVLDVNLTETSYEWDSGLSPSSTSSSVTVVANDGINEGRATVENLNVEGAPVLAAPINLTAEVSGETVVLNWTAPGAGQSLAKKPTKSPSEKQRRQRNTSDHLTTNKTRKKSFSQIKQYTNLQPVELSNGVPVASTVAQDAVQEYFIAIPEEATTLIFKTSNSTGDPDLFVKVGAPPNLDNGDSDFVSEQVLPDEEFIIVDLTTDPPIRTGNWFVSVFGFEASTFTLTAIYTSPQELSNGVPVTGQVGFDEVQEFFIRVPADASTLRFETINSTGDPDLFVRFGTPPSLANFISDFESENEAPEEELILVDQNTSPPIQNGDWFVTVYGFDVSSFTLTASHDGGGGGNSSPMLNAIGNKTAAAGQLLEFTISATDPDQDAITLEANNLPDGATFADQNNGTGIFRWTPADDQIGAFEVTFVARDHVSGSDSETVQIIVQEAGGILGYNVYRSTTTGARITGQRLVTLDASVTSFTDTGAGVGNLFYQVTAVYERGESGPSNEANVLVTNVGQHETVATPSRFALHQNYPNPFNPGTRIRFDLPKAAQVQIEVYNLRGQKVRTLVDEHRPTGRYSVVWDGRDDSGLSMPSGAYIYRLVAVEFTQSRKLLLLR